MPPVRRNKHAAVLSPKKKEGSAATRRKNKKQRLRQRLHLMPMAASVDAEGRLIAMMDALFAQLARTEVRKLTKGGSHAPEQ